MSETLSRRVVSASFWAISMRWSIRLLGVFSTLVLVRLLSPQDFGIVAMAMVGVGLVSVLLDFGVNIAIIQKTDPTDEFYNSAWTMRIAQSVGTAFILTVSASYISAFFSEPRMQQVLYCIALSVFISGFENIGMVTFQKNLHFSQDFKFFVIRKLSVVLTTLTLAFFLRSYWALVAGILTGSAAGVIYSYILSNYRPRLSVREIKDLWSFSQWVLVRNIGAYLQTKLDQVVVGSRFGSSILGLYSVADELASAPTNEVLAPINRALFPAFSEVKGNREHLKKLFSDAYGFQAVLALPMGCGLFMIADYIVPVVMGKGWEGAIPVIRILSLIGVVLALRHSPSSLLTAIGKVKLIAVGVWVQLAFFALICIIVFPQGGIILIALTRLAMSSLQTLAFLCILIAQGLCSFGGLIHQIWRPATASVIMMSILVASKHYFPSIDGWNLMIHLALGVLSYASGIIGLWLLSGRPDGAEHILLSRLMRWREAV